MKLVICDFNRTLYDPKSEQLFPGAIETLKQFKQSGTSIVLLSTENQSRLGHIQSLQLEPYITEIMLVAKKTALIVSTVLDIHSIAPADALLIGDDPEGELAIGKQLHVPTLAVGTGFCDEQTAKKMNIPFCPSIKEIKEYDYESVTA